MNLIVLRVFAAASIAAAAASEPSVGSACSCEQVAALEANLGKWTARVADLEEKLGKLLEAAASSTPAQEASSVSEGAKRSARPQAIREVRVGSEGLALPEQRRLQSSAGATHLSLPSRHVHEFPSGHTCGDVAGFMAMLPVKKADSAPTWQTSPSDVTADASLVKVASDWSTTAISSLPVPIKVVHDASCSAAPSLQLQGNTDVAGTFTVNGDTLGSVHTHIYTGGASGLAASGCCTYLDTGLTKTVTLTRNSTVLVSYQLGMRIDSSTHWNYVFTRLVLNSDGGSDTVLPEANGAGGTAGASTAITANTGIYFGTLPAGSHAFRVTYQTESGTSVGYYEQSLQVLVL